MSTHDLPLPRSQPGLWLGLSIAATALCCLPLGVVGIVYAAQAMSAQGRGDYSTAAFQTAQAKKWTIAAFVVTMVVGVLYFCFVRSQLGI